jgi:hypothetical protein
MVYSKQEKRRKYRNGIDFRFFYFYFLTLIKLKVTIILLKIFLLFWIGGIKMAITEIPEWMNELENEDLTFIKHFLKSSGSLKEIALLYGVTYPTVRLRLDRLIQKIDMNQDQNEDAFIFSVKKLALDEKITIDAARTIITKYKDIKRSESL